MKKERIDILVVSQGLTASREQAKRLIMAGQVLDLNGQRYDKPGEKIDATTELKVKGEVLRYVSRGGLKLEKALDVFEVSAEDKILLDVGASTGGFTDAALQHGAKKSYALDVGYNQLAWSLRQDPRVVVMERENFRYTTPELFKEGTPNFVSIDVSFISLRLILPPVLLVTEPDSDVLALIKPQFEAGRENVGKNGIVKDPQIHEQVLRHILTFAQQSGFVIKGLTFSPITGGEGNIEFLVHLKTPSVSTEVTPDNPDISLSDEWAETIKSVMNEAYRELRS
ncbi:TlyA family RNA methyltransferase [Atopobacter phocae]|uniref:TlyA family RNA methyltransferase n=1 Tax=Atopobacter phocae TaxID=136492 RepID=UPI00046EDF08|nr:TlyA family RNA methyltransferase [Atopobacter phocae]